MRLALDIGLGGLPLGVERIEILLKPLLGRDPRIDRAAQDALARPILHGASPDVASCVAVAVARPPLLRRLQSLSRTAAFPWRSPKKRWPFQLVPVIVLAIWDRLP